MSPADEEPLVEEDGELVPATAADGAAPVEVPSEDALDAEASS